MTLKQCDLDYFSKRGEVENPRYWSRLGGRPDFTNAVVGDIGCGHGSLCVDIALSGARKVIGFDLNANLIDFARENMQQNYPQLANTLDFRFQDVREAPEDNFDFFVSKDTFEHVIDLPQVLAGMKQRLRSGGRIYTGFGPLWNSPFGDHGRTRMPFRWGHVLFSESYLIARLNRRLASKGQAVTSIYDLGLNKLPLSAYRRIFNECGLSIIMFRINNSTRPLSRVFSLLRKLPLMEEYFSHNIYCILEKPQT